jgi:hypothetical protein
MAVYSIDQEVWNDLLEGFCPLDSEPMPASGAGQALQVIAGLWLALLASTIWYRSLCQPVRKKIHERVLIPQCSSSKRRPNSADVAAKRIDF